MYPTLHLYIDGQFLSPQGRQGQTILDPGTQQALGFLPWAEREDLEQAVQAASRAFSTWRRTSPMERSAVLRRVAELARSRIDDIALAMTLDNGKPLAEARAEVLNSAEHAEWNAEQCRCIYGRVVPPRHPDVRQLVVREPIGVCAALSTWNFPLGQAIKKVAAAIGAGCTVVLNGPKEAPSAVMALARLFHDAGLPAGVLNLVWGQSSTIAQFLIEAPQVRKITFTGSVPVGKQLAALAGAHMKRVSMELGGHAPVLVFPDADIEDAADLVARLKVRNAGQVCVSPSRIYVHAKVHDRFVASFAEAIRQVKVGHGTEEGVQMGPLIHERRRAAIEALIEDAVAQGGEVLAGGHRLGNLGHFHAPTVVAGVPDTARAMQEEPFGPLACVTSFTDTEAVLQRANSVPYGLASYVFTQSLRTATQVSNGLEAGMVNINHSGMAHPELPFGGIKDSGIGSEGGQETFDAFLVTKMITQV